MINMVQLDKHLNAYLSFKALEKTVPTIRMTVLTTLPVQTTYVNAHQAIQRPLARYVSQVDT